MGTGHEALGTGVEAGDGDAASHGEPHRVELYRAVYAIEFDGVPIVDETAWFLCEQDRDDELAEVVRKIRADATRMVIEFEAREFTAPADDSERHRRRYRAAADGLADGPPE